MGVLAGVAVVLLAGAAAQRMCARRDRRRRRPEGRMVTGLHVRETGTHGPVIVFEAGIAATSLNWRQVQSELRSRARSYGYDRAGLGWSLPSAGERSLQRLTDDLHRLIRALDLPRPLVLCGHSFGTLVVRVYASRFPDDVSALVLVDPVMPEEFAAAPIRTRLRLFRAWCFACAGGALAEAGVVRLALWSLFRRGAGNPGPILGLHGTPRRIATEVAKLPGELVPELRARWSEPRFFRELAASIRALPSCADEARRHPLPPGLSVDVLSGSHQTPEVLAMHAALATRHIVVPGSAHWIHLDRPDLLAETILAACAPR
jgi:pimeloyl-ACP methyl ester carboxylesterase